MGFWAAYCERLFLAIKIEEERLGALSLFSHLRRLLAFVGDKRFVLYFFVLLSTIQAGLELFLPMLVRKGIDDYIQPDWIRVHHQAIDNLSWSNQDQPDHAGFVYLRRSSLSKTDMQTLLSTQAIDAQGFVSEELGFVTQAEYLRLDYDQRLRIRAEDRLGVMHIALFYLGLLVLIFGLGYVVTYGLNHLGQTSVMRVRQALWSRMLRLRVRFYDQNPVGRLVTRVANDPANISELFTSVLATALADLLMFVGVLSFLFYLDMQTSLYLFIIAPVFVLLVTWFKRTSRRIYRAVRLQLAKINTQIQESFSGLLVIRSFLAQRRAIEQFYRLNQDYLLTQVKLVHVFAVFRPMVDVFSTLALALVVWYAAGQALANLLSLGTLVAFLLYLKLLFRPLQNLADKFNILQSSVVSSERMLRLLDEAPEAGLDGPQPVGKHVEIKEKLSVVFDDVRFSYEPGQPVLKGVSFRVDPGEKVALVGPTGSGKSTLISLLLGFYSLPKGQGNILVGRRDIRDWNANQLRRQFSLVQQDLFLFSGNVGENISLFGQADDVKLEHALSISRLNRVLRRLDGGLQHQLGERGGQLSQGERQLVSIARALALGGPFLILDEATSAVDSRTEALIQEALDDVLRDRTALIVAHRLSTVRACDRILVLNSGVIVESGTHDELIDKKGFYDHLYQAQLLDFACD